MQRLSLEHTSFVPFVCLPRFTKNINVSLSHLHPQGGCPFAALQMPACVPQEVPSALAGQLDAEFNASAVCFVTYCMCTVVYSALSGHVSVLVSSLSYKTLLSSRQTPSVSLSCCSSKMRESLRSGHADFAPTLSRTGGVASPRADSGPSHPSCPFTMAEKPTWWVEAAPGPCSCLIRSAFKAFPQCKNWGYH